MGIDHIFQFPLLIVIVRGLSTQGEILAAFDQLALDNRMECSECIILDLRYADYAPSHEELEMIADHLRSIKALRGKRWAVVAQQVSILFGNVRLFCAFMKSKGFNTELFWAYSKAMSWALLG